MLYVQEDPNPKEHGFYVVCSDYYDVNIDIQHTHRENFNIEFDRDVEPGIIKIFDMDIQYESEEKINHNAIRVVSTRDDEFIMDYAKYSEDKIIVSQIEK